MKSIFMHQLILGSLSIVTTKLILLKILIVFIYISSISIQVVNSSNTNRYPNLELFKTFFDTFWGFQDYLYFKFQVHLSGFFLSMLLVLFEKK